MKTVQRFVCLLLAVLLGACTVQSPETPIPPTATPTPTRTPRPTPTPTAAVAFLCPPASSSQTDWECRERTRGWTRTCSPASPSEQEWKCYEDLNYRFALEYPASFQVSIPINVVSPMGAGVIVRRHEIIGSGIAAVDLDIWPASTPDLASWMQMMRSISGPVLFPVMEPNATVAGHPAVVFIMGPEGPQSMFTVFFSDGAHVYRLWYTMLCHEEGLPTVRRMLDSIRFSPEPVPAEIPDDVWEQAWRICTSRYPPGP